MDEPMHCQYDGYDRRLKEALSRLCSGDPDERPPAIKDLAELGAAAVPGLADILRDESRDESLRAAAVVALGKTGCEGTLPALLEALHDEGSLIRPAAVLALSRFDSPEALATLVGRLGDDNGRVRRAVAVALELLGTKAVEPLARLLRADDAPPPMRRRAARVLGSIGNQEALASLAEAARCSEQTVRCAAVVALAQHGEDAVAPLVAMLHGEESDVDALEEDSRADLFQPPAVELVIAAAGTGDNTLSGAAVETLNHLGYSVAPVFASLLSADEDTLRWDAVELLGELRGGYVVDLLVAALGHVDPETRRLAAVQLGRSTDPRALPYLIRATDDECWFVRWQAIETLGQFDDVKVIEPLVAALTDTDPFVAQAAVRALGATANPRAVEPLISVVGTRSSDVGLRCEAACSLALIGNPRAFDPLLEIAQSWREPTRLRSVATSLLGSLGGPKGLTPLLGLVEDGDPDVRRAALKSIGELASGEHVAVLARALQNEDWQVRLEALRSVAGTGAAQADLIAPLIDDEHECIRMVAAQMLRHSSDAQARQAMVVALGSIHPEVRRVAVAAAGDRGMPEDGEALIEATLYDTDSRVRQHAASALGRIGGSNCVAALRVALNDPDAEVSKRAERALKRIGDDEAVSCVRAQSDALPDHRAHEG